MHVCCQLSANFVSCFAQASVPISSAVLVLWCRFAGKSTLAQQLASRINIPNVMQTDVIYEVICCPILVRLGLGTRDTMWLGGRSSSWLSKQQHTNSGGYVPSLPGLRKGV